MPFSFFRLALLALAAGLAASFAASSQDSHVCQSGDCQNGYGTSLHETDLVGSFSYTGTFRNGRPHGQGRLQTEEGGVFEGRFEDFEPVEGKAVETDGAVYTGTLKDWAYSGKGTMSYPDGDTYSGDWMNGNREGTGTLTSASGDTFTGEWIFDAPVRGTLTYADGSVYPGEIKQGLHHGTGRILYPDGEYYDGTWAYGKRSGKGVYVQSSAAFEGLWANDALVSATVKLSGGGVYTGALSEDGRFGGQGKMTYPDGMIYEGGWMAGKRSGTGRAVFPDGRVFDGNWADDLPVSGTLQVEGAEPVPVRFEAGAFVADEAGAEAVDPGSGWGQ